MNFVFEKNNKNFIYSLLRLNFASAFWPKGFNAVKTGNKQKDKSLLDLLVFEKNNGNDAKEFSLAQRYTLPRPVYSLKDTLFVLTITIFKNVVCSSKTEFYCLKFKQRHLLPEESRKSIRCSLRVASP